MNDPLDSLRRLPSSTQPHPSFRASLMREVEEALTAADSDGESTGHSATTVTTPAGTTVEITKDDAPSPKRFRTLMIAALGVAAAAAVVVGLVRVNREHSAPEPAGGSTPPAARPTTAPLTVPLTSPPGTTTTTVPPLTDEQIATAGLLSSTEVGDSYLTMPGDAFHLTADGGAGAGAAACAPFLDTVFESAARPATVEVRAFGKPGASMQQYVVVFPDQSGADAMMLSLSDPAFPACWSAIVTEAFTALDQSSGLTNRTPQLPITPRPLTTVGDHMVVLSTSGSFTYQGTVYTDEGLVPFVQVGRAITWMNPSSAPTVVGSPGYPDAQLETALAAAVAHLRAAQGG